MRRASLLTPKFVAWVGCSQSRSFAPITPRFARTPSHPSDEDPSPGTPTNVLGFRVTPHSLSNFGVTLLAAPRKNGYGIGRARKAHREDRTKLQNACAWPDSSQGREFSSRERPLRKAASVWQLGCGASRNLPHRRWLCGRRRSFRKTA